ncbi:MAG: sulfatase modifying factor 1 precursor, partial [Candidatus Magnetoglobus multicellularis str. Araruama]
MTGTFTNRLGMTFVLIKAGRFMMGSPSNEPGRVDDETQHEVILTKDFYMQITEVTQGQWEAVMGNNPSRFKECGKNCPVEKVTWNDVQKFIKKINQMRDGQYRLPTETEWEYAARAGSTSAFTNGGISQTNCGEDSNLIKMGWYCGNSCVSYNNGYNRCSLCINTCEAGTHPVAKKMPNAWGLYDMHGNVWEWCSDWYGDYLSRKVTDSTGPSSGSFRVLRGGSWSDDVLDNRSAKRSHNVPNWSFRDLGLRLLRT